MVRQLLLLGAVVVAGGLGAAWGPWSLRDVIGDTIAVFAILAAFLVQIMLLLVTAFQPGNLSADRIRQIGERLAEEQSRAALVFFAYLVTIGAAVACKVAAPASATGAPFWLVAGVHALTSIGAAGAAYGVIGTVLFVRSLGAIQALRHRLMVEEAEARESARRRELADSLGVVPPPSQATGTFGRRFNG